MAVGDQALTWYGAFRQLVTEVIDAKLGPYHSEKGKAPYIR
jgi:hypothetical protein